MAVRIDAGTEEYTATLSLGSLSKFSVCCWAKISIDRNTYSTLWSIDNGAGDLFYCRSQPDGTSIEMYDELGINFDGGALTVGTWYFIGVSVNAGAGTLTYKAMDAASFTTNTWSGGSTTLNAATLRIGDSATGGQWWNGCVSAFKLWSTVTLTAAEMQAEAYTFMPIRVANLAAWYPLLEPETADYSGNSKSLSGGSGTSYEDGPAIAWGPWRVISSLPTVVVVTHDLASAGLASSSGTAAANVLYPLASVGLAGSSGTAAANLVMPLVSIGLAASSGAAVASLTMPLASAALAASSGAGILNTLGSMVADGLAASSGTAVALIGVTLAADGVAASSGVAGAQVISGLASDGLTASVGIGSLVAAAMLEGIGVVAETGAVDLLTVITLDASGVASSSGAVDFLTIAVLASDGRATETGAGIVELTMPLTGAAVATEAGTAAVGIEAGLGATGLAASTGAASLTHQATLSAEGLVTEAATGALTATWTLMAAVQATSSGSAELVVGFIFAGFATSSGSANLTLTITLGTAIGLEAATGDNELGIDTFIDADARGSSSGRAVLYIALPYIPGPTHAPGRGAGGGVFGPDNRTRAAGPDTGRTHA